VYIHFDFNARSPPNLDFERWLSSNNGEYEPPQRRVGRNSGGVEEVIKELPQLSCHLTVDFVKRQRVPW